jgi:hypothetical protein
MEICDGPNPESNNHFGAMSNVLVQFRMTLFSVMLFQIVPLSSGINKG